MLTLSIRVPTESNAKTSNHNEQLFKLVLEDIEVGRLAKALVNLPLDAIELDLNFVLRTWYAK